MDSPFYPRNPPLALLSGQNLYPLPRDWAQAPRDLCREEDSFCAAVENAPGGALLSHTIDHKVLAVPSHLGVGVA